MGSVLVYPGDESISLSGTVTRKLMERGDGDAALLYIALLKHHGEVQPRDLAGELRWERLRVEAAEKTLQEIGLLASTASEVPPAPADERPDYQHADVAEHLEKDAAFRGLIKEVEKRLGKKLTTPDIGVLLGLNDYLGLPEDVIYLLVCHCAERVQLRYGPGRRPGMKLIEKEGYTWARRGIDTQAAAADYLKEYALRQGRMPRYMQALQLGDRAPAPSEERYLNTWQEMGFPPEAVALAYDRTMLNCHQLKWPYCNGILKRWHEAGCHTVEEILAEDRPAGKRTEPAGAQKEDVAWMKKYIQRRDKED